MGTEGVVRVVVDKLESILAKEEKLGLTPDLHDEVVKIINESKGLFPFLRAADARTDMEEVEIIWVKRVINASLDVEDILDDFGLHLLQFPRQGRGLYNVCCFILNHIIFLKLTVQMRSIHKRFHQILKEIPDGLIAVGSSSSASVNDRPMIPLLDEEDDLVGTERMRRKLLQMLVDGELKFTAISVLGFHGSGKTALVKQVFNSPDVNKYFDCCAWFTLSENCNTIKLMRRMIKQVDQQVGQEVDSWTLEKLGEHFQEYMRDKRFVIVLDDVPNRSFWHAIEYAFSKNMRGSRVIITINNSYNVASSHLLEIKDLSPKEAWCLFCKRAFPPDARCPPELEEISQEIVQKCGGLPLAIVVTGSFFSRKARHESEWEQFLDNLGNHMESNTRFKTIVRLIKLCYKALPNNLKFCILYMGIFPKDVPIRIRRLIRLWIAEGFVQAMEGKTAEEVAEGYLNDLIGRSLVRVSEFHDDGRLRSCQIHEYIRRIILCDAKQESFAAASYGGEMSLYSGTRRLSINIDFKGSWLLKKLHHLRLRSLLVFREEGILMSPKQGNICRFRLLKVLDLEGTHLKSFPTEIKNLLLLRYLSLRNTMITCLPKSLGKLVNIETLDLKGTGISVLPIEILQLKGLRHLIVGRHDMNGVSVPHGIGRLSALQTLTCIDVTSAAVVISELGNLMQMRRLCIANLRSEDGTTLCSSIGKMDRLISFKALLKDDNQTLDLPAISPTPPHLQHVHLSGRLEKLPDWVVSLRNLVKMSLSGSRLTDDPLKILQSLPNLAVLTFTRAYDGKELCCEAKGLPKLKVLNLVELDELESVRVEEGAMPYLQKLHLDECKRLEKVPFGIEHLTCVKELYVMNAPDALTERISSDGGVDHWKIRHIPLIRTKAISTPAGMASGDGDRASWSDCTQRKLFIDLCLKEANNGGRSGGTLKRTSWSRIIQELGKKTGIVFTKKQLQNSWDYMKKQYETWLRLVSATGHGFNASMNTLDWPAERWEDYLKTHPDAKQFRYKRLQFSDEMAALFDDILVTGSTSWSSHREGIPENGSPFQSIQGLSQITADFNPQTPTPYTTPLSAPDIKSDADLLAHEKNCKKEKKAETPSEIEAPLKTLAKDADPGPTIEKCKNSLDEMSLLMKTDPLYIVALTAFCEKREYRQMWMNIKEEEVRIAWLRAIATRLGLKFSDEMAALFDDILVTGSTSWSSHREGIPENGSTFPSIQGLSQITTDINPQTPTPSTTPLSAPDIKSDADLLAHEKSCKKEKKG